MKRKNFLLLLVTVLLVLGLAGCVQRASTAPKGAGSPTAEGEFPLPGSTDDVMGQLESFATQTAIALSGGTVVAPPPTSVPPAQGTPGSAQVPQATTGAPQATTAVQQAASPSKTPIVVPTATPGKPNSWSLQKGEHPFCIARRFDVNPNDLLDASGLSGGSSYSVGTVLKIPHNGRGFPGKRSLKSHPATYTVSSKDTIYSIACEYGDVDPYAIAAANGLSAPYKLDPGQELAIP